MIATLVVVSTATLLVVAGMNTLSSKRTLKSLPCTRASTAQSAWAVNPDGFADVLRVENSRGSGADVAEENPSDHLEGT
jgi:hypothetical protein